MALHPISRWGVLALACTALAGCGSSDLSDLQAYVAEIKSRQKGTVAPLPELKPATPFVFNTEDFRDPFGSAEREEHQETAGGNGIRLISIGPRKNWNLMHWTACAWWARSRREKSCGG
ncbi:pilus assembly protein PilP [Methylogaea oryzae]|uniref:pilus assembly protein PilP n=1 Tax=Methylogaea oryzae TaxID=1295382 RepID=UPI0020CFE95E|nr:pilus assembly protein PilP [Methylogaea oryzae]